MIRFIAKYNRNISRLCLITVCLSGAVIIAGLSLSLTINESMPVLWRLIAIQFIACIIQSISSSIAISHLIGYKDGIMRAMDIMTRQQETIAGLRISIKSEDAL